MLGDLWYVKVKDQQPSAASSTTAISLKVVETPTTANLTQAENALGRPTRRRCPGTNARELPDLYGQRRTRP